MTSQRLKTILLAGLATVALVGAPQTSRAQVPTLDNSVLAKATETVANTLKQVQTLTSIEGVLGRLGDAAGVGTQLGQLKGLLTIMGNPQDAIGALTQMGQLRGIFNVLGQLGQGGNILGSLGSIASMLGGGGSGSSLPDFSGMRPNLGSVGQYGSLSGNQSFSRPFNQLNSLFQQPPNNIGQIQTRLQENLYFSGSGSAADVEGINAVRAANTRSAAVNGMAIAVQGKDYTAKAPDEIKKLAGEAKQTKDVRGDIQANTAVLLKILEALQQGNAQLAAMTHLSAATTIATDNYNAGRGDQ